MTMKKGDVKTVKGLKFVYNGSFWALDGTVDTIDRHHNYSGHQDPKKPYRGAKEAHVITGTKLLR
jgi:hypothetical protein